MMARFVLAVLLASHILAVALSQSNDDFFRQATRSISHDKKVLKRLESHPLAHASGWDLSNGGQVCPFTLLYVLMIIPFFSFVRCFQMLVARMERMNEEGSNMVL